MRCNPPFWSLKNSFIFVCVFDCVIAALIFGKPATNVKAVRMHSLSVEWSDSDSSVDSMPNSGDEGEDEENEFDWPEERGFQVSCGYSGPPPLIQPPLGPVKVCP